jgi:hypothetical protein
MQAIVLRTKSRVVDFEQQLPERLVYISAHCGAVVQHIVDGISGDTFGAITRQVAINKFGAAMKDIAKALGVDFILVVIVLLPKFANCVVKKL